MPLIAGAALAESPQPASLGALEFGPEGVLFAADPKGAAVFALEVGGADARAEAAMKIEKLDDKIAALLGTKSDQIRINDLVIDPRSGAAYLSVSRGLGPDKSVWSGFGRSHFTFHFNYSSGRSGARIKHMCAGGGG